MTQHQRLLIVVADGEHARFVRPSKDSALHSETVIDSATAHKRSAELGSDQPGASFHSGSTVHHSVAPRHDPHELEKEKFGRLIAHEINAANTADSFDQLVLVAPPHVMNTICGELEAGATAKLLGTLEKDLVKTPDHELYPHLSDWVPPAYRPST